MTLPQDPRAASAAHSPRNRRPEPLRAPAAFAPPAVAEAVAAHQSVTERYDRAQQAVQQAQRAAAEARADDVRIDAERVAAGDDPLPATKRTAPNAERQTEEAEHQLAAIATAGALTAEQLTTAIIDDRDAWLAVLVKREAEAADECEQALAEMRSATAQLATLRAAARWLERVDADRRELPLNDGTRTRLDVMVAGREFPIDQVLAGLGEVADPPAPPQPRTHRTARAA